MGAVVFPPWTKIANWRNANYEKKKKNYIYVKYSTEKRKEILQLHEWKNIYQKVNAKKRQTK